MKQDLLIFSNRIDNSKMVCAALAEHIIYRQKSSPICKRFYLR